MFFLQTEIMNNLIKDKYWNKILKMYMYNMFYKCKHIALKHI